MYRMPMHQVGLAGSKEAVAEAKLVIKSIIKFHHHEKVGTTLCYVLFVRYVRHLRCVSYRPGCVYIHTPACKIGHARLHCVSCTSTLAPATPQQGYGALVSLARVADFTTGH
jgi:hypothetical protein